MLGETSLRFVIVDESSENFIKGEINFLIAHWKEI